MLAPFQRCIIFSQRFYLFQIFSFARLVSFFYALRCRLIIHSFAESRLFLKYPCPILFLTFVSNFPIRRKSADFQKNALLYGKYFFRCVLHSSSSVLYFSPQQLDLPFINLFIYNLINILCIFNQYLCSLIFQRNIAFSFRTNIF